MITINEIYRLLNGIKVFALVGPSGTGKSFRSQLVAQKNGINYVIDDGLLIHEDKILAGKSAKKEATYMAAVRTALFDSKEHRDEVARAIHKCKAKKILILATSDKMAARIAARLQLPQPQRIIKIEDIASQEEIQQAIRSRNIEGKHVIPVPSLEVKRTYPQIFYDEIRIFLKRTKIVGTNSKVFEKSVVRPTFSKKGRVEISETAIDQMVRHCVTEFDANIEIKKTVFKPKTQGYRIVVTVDVPFGTQLTGTIYKLQQYITENVERFTGIMIEEVNIIIDQIRPTATMLTNSTKH